MSNRTDFMVLASELVNAYGVFGADRMAFTTRLGNELHNAFVAGQEKEYLDGRAAKLQQAIEVARSKGEHYPICNMPPPEIRNLPPDDTKRHEWREQNRNRCTCWKAEMEALLK